ncbi:Integrase core domain protein [compost metagenome]
MLGQIFEPTRPNEVWTGDITYIPTDEGWLYLAGLKDVFTCEIVGYAVAERMTTELVSRALFRAVQHKRPSPGLLHHTDRGSQYCTKAYRGLQEHVDVSQGKLLRQRPDRELLGVPEERAGTPAPLCHPSRG